MILASSSSSVRRRTPRHVSPFKPLRGPLVLPIIGWPEEGCTAATVPTWSGGSSTLPGPWCLISNTATTRFTSRGGPRFLHEHPAGGRGPGAGDEARGGGSHVQLCLRQGEPVGAHPGRDGRGSGSGHDQCDRQRSGGLRCSLPEA